MLEPEELSRQLLTGEHAPNARNSTWITPQLASTYSGSGRVSRRRKSRFRKALWKVTSLIARLCFGDANLITRA